MDGMQNKVDSSTRRQPRHPKPPFVGVGGKIEDRVDEAQDVWILMEEEARKRVGKAKELPPERWGEMWGVDEE
jgi:hypothetical protein